MKRFKKHFLVLFIGSLASVPCFSQDDNTGNNDNAQVPNETLIASPPPPEEIFYKESLEGGGGIIYPITNKALRISLNGVYYLHFSGNYVFAPHFFAGLELENTQLGSTASTAPFGTLMYIYSVGAKAGYYTYMQKDFLLCYSVSIGPSLIKYVDAPNPAPKGGFMQNSFFMTPNFLAGFRVNNELRIGLELSYIFMAYRFDPTYTGISNYITYNPKDANAITTCFEWGFGVYWAFAEPAK